MDKEELIKKWLDHNLNPEEQIAFERLEDYDQLLKLSKNMTHFSAPEYDIDVEQKKISKAIHKTSNNWIRPLLKFAAVLLIGFSVFYFVNNIDETTSTEIAELKSIELPDNSMVNLNAVTELTFNKNKWEQKREVHLEGEAYFKVSKGSKFDVITKFGKVSVLGTEFNVKQRNNFFEVTCYEGLVAVSYKSTTIKLKPTQKFSVINNIVEKGKDTKVAPSWLNNESSFTSKPLFVVLDELKHHYNITINSENIDTQQLFSGRFTHDDLNLALQSITLPLGVTYTIKDSVIVLTRE